MNLRYLFLAALLLLTACDDNKTASEHPNSSGTFAASTETAAMPVASVSGETVAPLIVTPDVAPPPMDAVVESPADVARKEATKLAAVGRTLEAGNLLAEAGLEEEAFALLAPTDRVIHDPNTYGTSDDEAIELSVVDETTSVKRSKMMINGTLTPFTAQAGHLIAYAPKDAAAGQEAAEAAIFYTAYTRDGLPKDKRPVTFLWNGGPGSASIWLHMGSWGPVRLKSDAPSIPEEFYKKQPESLPLEENAITLLDKTDLVFVDPPGTGYSTAISPYINNNFWGTDADARLLHDFIIRYNNVNNRQTSPKYLYGESYGGIRTPIVADLLLNEGTARFLPESSGKQNIVLSGVILNSPLLDYQSNCNMNGAVSCAGYVPSYAMIGDYHKLATARGNASAESYLQTMRTFVTEKYLPLLKEHPLSPPDGSPLVSWKTFVATQPGKDLLAELQAKTGIPETQWAIKPKIQTGMGAKQSHSGLQVGAIRWTHETSNIFAIPTGQLHRCCLRQSVQKLYGEIGKLPERLALQRLLRRYS
ncbi:S10 family serine carboxypeptidase-like protein [Phyllobacterium pellucidum]|uniref:S10 family serine carboxypeptidase-like protein n=1 Tax=Phyllobacterium pellucidum TaxID=2740464 RepID=UPI001D15C483|nr:hypothetical protein [Phyllobacterium sp. T1018]UGY10422.1 hypothetical protein LLE51_004335 [Phyllobacterium sp. T1018]